MGGDACLVGGCLRDLLLGRTVKDLDVALQGDTIAAGKRLADTLGGSFVLLHQETSTVRVVIPRPEGTLWVDMVPLQGTLEQDLKRRDFTINAMGLPLRGGDWSAKDLVDPTGGLIDLVRKRIRQVSSSTFSDDPLRLLRAFRISTVLRFQIEPATMEAIRRHVPEITTVSPERIRDEVFSLLETRRAAEGILACDQIGLLTTLAPELAALHGCTQNANHHLDVWEHTVEAIRRLEETPLEGAFGGEVAAKLARHLGEPITPPRSRWALMKFALLFHDVTKPQTRAVEDGRVRFIGHDRSSALLGARAARQLRLSKREEMVVRLAIANHLRPGFLAHQLPLSKHAIYRFFRDLGDTAPEALVLSYADRQAARGPATTASDFELHRALTTRLLEEFFREKESPRPKLLTGSEVIAEFGIGPGPRVGKLLATLEEAHATGEVTTREEAVEFLRARVERDG